MFYKALKWVLIAVAALLVLPTIAFLWFELTFDVSKLPANYGKVNSQLFLAEGERQPLVVFFGGSEGGNSMAKTQNEDEKKVYIDNGYALLAIGYFGMPGIPSQLDRISLDGIHQEIMRTVKRSNIDENCIVVAGGSKGAELALTLASKFPTIKGAVSLAGSHVVFAGTSPFTDGNASSFMHHDEQVNFVPFTKNILPKLITSDFRGAYEILLEDKQVVKNAVIEVEKINGPILLISGEKDQIWPSQEMSDEVIARLTQTRFKHAYKHIKVASGNHFKPQSDYHHEVVDFLNDNFLPNCAKRTRLTMSMSANNQT